MIYCVSDIHGELDKLERMMELIRFSDADHLYIIGDVIDRGVMGVDILRWIMAAPNMTMLLGNHEQMCLDTLGPKNEFGARDLWRQNGGMPNYRELLYHRAPTERSSILRFLAGLPDHLELEVGRRTFHLVHTPTYFLTEKTDEGHRIWHGNNIIDIDCGCGNLRSEHRRLACLRLDDMAEFYVGNSAE